MWIIALSGCHQTTKCSGTEFNAFFAGLVWAKSPLDFDTAEHTIHAQVEVHSPCLPPCDHELCCSVMQRKKFCVNFTLCMKRYNGTTAQSNRLRQTKHKHMV